MPMTRRLLVAAQCQPRGTDIVPAVAGVNGRAPLARQCGQQRQGVAAGQVENAQVAV